VTNTDELKQFNQSLIAEFRANGGKINISGWENVPVLLLTTQGVRSGKPHTTPLGYTTDADRFIIIAANQGALSHPHWYRNLVAHPDVTVELGHESWPARAVVARGPERDRLFNQHAAKFPSNWEFQSKTTRQMPVVILARVLASTSLHRPAPETA
jgi:deazaflavin-dependent oxidoreductase (nitroreductase family)